jgi:hypothetical protein
VRALIVLLIAAASQGLAGCATRGDTVGGAAAGGIIGYQAGERYDRR